MWQATTASATIFFLPGGHTGEWTSGKHGKSDGPDSLSTLLVSPHFMVAITSSVLSSANQVLIKVTPTSTAMNSLQQGEVNLVGTTSTGTGLPRCSSVG